MLIAEELLLLALDPAEGSPVNSSRQPLTMTLSGALIAELGLAHGVVVDGKRFHPVGPTPPDPLLAAAHRAVGTVKGRRAADQVRRLDKALGGVWSTVVDRLVEEKVIGRERRRMLLFPVTRHPVLRTDLRDEVVRRAQEAARGSGPLDARTAALLALAGPSRLLEVVAPDRADHKHAKERIATATAATPVAPVVVRVLREAQAATNAAIGASVAATAGSSSA
ncbi:GOLPH3/VPS74 family protein [Frankia nepalensis]|uniref:GPP34 family phosphoprotein n=1 Tax=Frankia nepalensis TaxID=1836974 RepID=A0A937RHU6_9ACTN|nr:GPP34 family phosphoprotein [Frankia nepalensis]MBL7496311.1 GPP34 family phosphoprotein [Frankia nepalensis]MBL7508492.1 GPP34 family phosphoprotein [Frankia nepalensis]MBL7627624.1 GPP34 family phosphoprotein [Frankia nepalensis]